MEVLRSYLKLQEKDCLNKIIYLSVLVAGQYHAKFSRKSVVQFHHFKHVMYVQRTPLKPFCR